MSIGKFLRFSSRTDHTAEIEAAPSRAGWSAVIGRHGSTLRRAAAAALIAIAGLAGTADTALAQINCGTEVGTGTGSGYASAGGTGVFRDSIFWLDWSCPNNTSFPANQSVTKSWTLSNGLSLTATISPRNVSISPYNTGSWQGDVLDNLYPGVNPIGLGNTVNGEDPSYSISFSTTVGGVSVPTSIVVAEAEDTGGPAESATWTTSGTAWQVIEGSGSLDVRFSNGGQTVYMEDNTAAGNRENGTILALAQNVTSISVSMFAGGGEALAFGLFVPFDYGDAPANYTNNGHYLIASATGGGTPTTLTPQENITRATLTYGAGIYLGAQQRDSELGMQSDSTATGDDTDGFDDETGVTMPPLYAGATTYTIPTSAVTAGGTGTLHAWIDFNRNDIFDTGEFASTSVSGGVLSSPLTWTIGTAVPTATTYYARFRITSQSLGSAGSATVARDGEVEDYSIVSQTLVIDAVNDNYSASPINGIAGGTTASVLDNDTVNGVAATTSNVTLTPGTAPTPAAGSLTMNANGTITVAPGTTAGTYSYPYTICSTVIPASCDTAIATVVVSAPPIDAVNDAPPAINGANGGSTASVLANDTLNGTQATTSNVTLTPGAAPTPAAGSITMNPSGIITVAPGTTAGTYSYSYTICDRINPTNCDTAVATVVVSPAPIDAVNDAPPAVNGANGGATASVLANDTLNGVAATTTTVALTPGTLASPPAAGSITMGSDGIITIAPGTTAGTYSYPYTICERLNPTNCDTATATVVVTAAPIDAVNDTPPPLNGTNGGTTASVLANDTLNGVAATTTTVALTPGTAPAPLVGSITMNANGTITVAPNTTAGTYTYSYTICERLNPTNCDTATATIVVEQSVIVANPDDFTTAPVNGMGGGNTPSVLLNDTLNGEPVDPADIVLTPSAIVPTPAAGSILMNA